MALKQELKDQILAVLNGQLADLEKAVKSAKEATTHSDVKSEGKYDTRAIEAGYMAGAQMERYRVLKEQIEAFSNVSPNAMHLFHALDANEQPKVFLVNPIVGGLTIERDEKINVIEKSHPIAVELMSSQPGDEVYVELPQRDLQFTIQKRL